MEVKPNENTVSVEEAEKARLAFMEMAKRENSLYMARVPKKTKQEFKKLAEEDFENDFGMTLKHLLDVYKGMMPLPESEVKDMLREFDERLSVVETKLSVPREVKKTKTISFGDGRKVEVETHE